MQYRCKPRNQEWSDWKDLPESLAFTEIWLPDRFEFRTVPYEMQIEPRFVFRDL